MTVRLFHPTHTALRLAVVSVQPAGDGQVHVAVARGASRHALTDSRLYGPFAAAEGAHQLDVVVQSLVKDGYVQGGTAALLSTLTTSTSPKERAHAAERLGWRRETAAVAALRARAEKPKDDISSVVLALGRIGAPAGIPEARAEAARKLLSRRRAGAEALRLLGDTVGLDEVAERARERLVEAEFSVGSAADMTARLVKLSPSKQGPVVDALYDLGTDDAVIAVRAALTEAPLGTPGLWRFVKSVFKRSMVRHDADTFGLLLVRIERLARTAKGGTVATLKSGLDGESRPTRVFSQRTADWLRRAGWRHLSRVGRYRPEDYTRLAAAVLVAHRPDDDLPPKGKIPASGHCHALMQIVHGAGGRYAVDRRRPIHRLKKGKAIHTDAREEMFGPLWDAPSAVPHIRRVLVQASHHQAIAMALRLARQHPAVVDDASAAELAQLRRHPAFHDRASALLRQRLRQRPLPVETLCALVAPDAGGAVDEGLAALVGSVLQDTAHEWLADDAVAGALLLGPPAIREVAARLVRAGAPSLSAVARKALAARLVDAVDAPEPVGPDGAGDGRFDGITEVVDVFADEIAAIVPLARARTLLARHGAGAAVASIVVGRLPDPVEALGVPELLRLAALPLAAQRGVVIAALAGAPGAFRSRPGLVLELVEGEWDDVRAACIVVLESMEATFAAVDSPDINALLAVCDSTWPAVQLVGQRFASPILEAGGATAEKLTASLAQHPHPAMRRFVMDIAEGVIGRGLRPGLMPLLRLEPLLRAGLFDVRPSRRLRSRIIGLLRDRGLADEAQAELAVSILKDVARSRTHSLRDDALAAIAVLAAVHPGAATVAAADGIRVADSADSVKGAA